MAKDMTIEDLAGMIKRGFDDVDRRFDDVDKRFDDVDKRFGDVDKRFGDVDKRFDQTATKQDFQIIVDQLDIVCADVHDIKITLGPLVRTVAAQEQELQDLRMRMSRVERKVGIAES